MADIIIRTAEAEDAAGLIEFLRLVGSESDNLTFGGEGLPISVEAEADFISSVNGQKTSVMLLALDGDEIIADAALSGMPRRMAHRAEMSISVKKSHWNRGVGSRLISELIDCAKRAGVEILSLDVRCDNFAAIHLYEKFGFKTIGTFPAFFKIGDEYADFYSMYLDLR